MLLVLKAGSIFLFSYMGNIDINNIIWYITTVKYYQEKNTGKGVLIMMDYETFKEVFAERIMDYLPPMFGDCKPHIEQVNKVNRTMDALTIQSETRNRNIAMPIIYLDEMYDFFREREDMDALLECAAEIIVNFTGTYTDCQSGMDLKEYKGNIVPNLVNTNKNIGLIEGAPHRDVLDMSVVYRIMIPSPRGGFDTLLITNSILEELDMTPEELHAVAIENISSVLPLRTDIIDGKGFYVKPGAPDSIVVVSSQQLMYGTAHMLREETLQELTQELGCDSLYLLPVSIHQFCVTKGDNNTLDCVRTIMEDTMHMIDRDREFLSDKIYCYDGASGHMQIAV